MALLDWVRNKKAHYNEFSLKKKSGGFRKINAPRPELKEFQRRIYQEKLKWLDVHPNAHGFIEGRSILTNAQRHVGSACIVNLDLKDFFPSITIEMVIASLKGKVKNPHAIAELCTFEGKLPQGAPTSPALSNIAAFKMDKQLARLAQKHKARYSRYADDITFSSEKNSNLHKIIPKAHSFILHNGFELNYNKIQVYRRGARQTVTGLTVNERATVPRPQKRKLRAMIHNAMRDGVDANGFYWLCGYNSFVKLTDGILAKENRMKLKDVEVRA